MKNIKKIGLILCFTFIIKIMASCIFPGEAPIFSFYPDKLRIQLLNNNHTYLSESEEDTLSRNAVALSLIITEKREMAGLSMKRMEVFAPVLATSPPDPEYIIENPVTRIRVVSLFSINEEVTAGTDVTNMFLFGDRQEFLYVTQAFALENQFAEPYPEPAIGFDMFLKPAVENDTAQFAIQVVLEDETVLSDTTGFIHLY